MLDLITTMNNSIYDAYGKKSIISYNEKLSKGVRLNIIFEGEIPDISIFDSKKIRFYNFVSSEWLTFFKKFGHLQEANGFKIERVVNDDKLQLKIHGPNYRWDAVRFSYKVFSIKQSLQIEDISKQFCWIDADTLCLKSFNKKDFNNFLPNKDELMTYLGRNSFPEDFPHMEAGFLGFNKDHPKFKSFINTMVSIYMSGEFFALAHWHDSFIWDRVREIFAVAGVKFRSLSGEYENKEHVFAYTGLGEFFDHLKGPKRKKQGFSNERFDKNNDLDKVI